MLSLLWSKPALVKPALVSLSILTTFLRLTHAFPTYFPITRSCGTPDPSSNLTSTHRWLQVNEPKENDLVNSTIISARLSSPLSARAPLITIPTYFHIVSSPSASVPSSSAYITDSQLAAQLEYMNTHYAPFSISFSLLATTRTTNAVWASNQDDFTMKSALRRGSYAALSIYFQSSLQAVTGPSAGTTLLGFCTLPASGITPNTSPDEYIEDGCNILSSTLPGGNYANYNLGGTTVHEAGHWLGLLHTFQDESCNPADFGDYVADTPQQRVPTVGCPAVGVDTCPVSGVAEGWTGGVGEGSNLYGPAGCAGVDGKENFMDYSSDGCYEGFSAGQGARMINIWGLYRRGK